MVAMNAAAVVTWLNLTSPVGWAVARAARCEISPRGPYWQATGYRWPFPVAAAFTVGSVVISREPLPEGVWRHEVVHIRQYTWLGPLFWPAYGLAVGYSWLRTGDWWSRNPFERRAGLRAGGYRERPVRALMPSRRRGGPDAVAASA